MFARLADRFVLAPSRNTIRADHKTRRLLDVNGRQVEVWVERTGEREPEVFVLKFNGAGGRAERTSVHPFDFWNDLAGEVWSPNPPGYGASEGPPSIKSLAPTARSVLEELLRVAGTRPIVLTGNSLGTTVALHLAARYANAPNLAGLILRNPPPLAHLIRGKFGWRTFGLSFGVARQIPPDLDSVANAARAMLPCVCLCSGCDRVVPLRFQQMVLSAYAGPKQVVTMPTADHACALVEPQLAEYRRALGWLRSHWECRMQRASATA